MLCFRWAWPAADPMLHTAHSDAPVQHEWLFGVPLHLIDELFGLHALRVVHVLAVIGILAFAYSMAAAGLHLAHLVKARMRTWPFRLGVSVPGQTFIAAGFMEAGWLLLLLPIRGLLWLLGFDGVLDALRWLDFLPFAVAVVASVRSPRPLLFRPPGTAIRMMGETVESGPA